MPNCLLCGSGVWYVGLFNADCTNVACSNFREPPRKEGAKPEYGSWAWAAKAHRDGWKIEFCRFEVSSVWHELISQLQETTDREAEYEFRIHQELYSPGSQYKRGTREWRDDMIKKGCKVRVGREEYEIMP